MTTLPKQSIYPLRYAGLSLRTPRGSERQFVAGLSALLDRERVHVIPIGRARAGLYLLAKLAVSERRRHVVLSPYTIPDVVNMVRFAGGIPVFVDVLPNSTNVDLEHLASLLDDNVCAVMVTHYHVNQDLESLRRICQPKSVLLIDDCALALGASETGGRIGTTTDASVFSLSGFKALNYFWGGAITTQSPDLARSVEAEVATWPRLRSKDYLAQALKLLKYDVATRNPLFTSLTFPLLRKKVLADSNAEILPMVRVESPSITPTIVSRPSVGALAEWSRKIGQVESFLSHRRSIAAIYDARLAPWLVGREVSEDVKARSCWVNYPIAVSPERRTDIYKKVLAKGFDIGLSLYPNVREIPGFADIPGRTTNVAALVRSVLYLPTHPGVTPDYASQLADTVAAVV